MADDNLERQEVDLLIKELASARPKPVLKKPAPASPAATQTAAPPKMTTAWASVQPQAPATPPVGTPGPVAHSRIAPPLIVAAATRRRTFISAINLQGLQSLTRLSTAHWRRRELPQQIQLLLARLGSATREVTQVRMCVALGVMLAVAMPFWPYPKVCTWWLLLYMFAVAMVIIAGVWGARLTWHTRLGIAHTVALIVVLWGITLGAEETLPRIGYAKAESVWICP